jgi:SAM-dependent methyltransferase
MKLNRFFEYFRFIKMFFHYRLMCDRLNLQRPRLKDISGVFGEPKTDHPFDANILFPTAWASRIIKKYMPVIHYDISSDLNFIATISAFVPVKYYEYRNLDFVLGNVELHKIDINALPFLDNSISSLSCLHVIEHIGLGRYGDPIDPDGANKAFRELNRVISVGGNLLFVVPMGFPRTRFNADRIYDRAQIESHFPNFRIMNFFLLKDNGNCLIENANNEIVRQQKYGLGCFWMQKNK